MDEPWSNFQAAAPQPQTEQGPWTAFNAESPQQGPWASFQAEAAPAQPEAPPESFGQSLAKGGKQVISSALSGVDELVKDLGAMPAAVVPMAVDAIHSGISGQPQDGAKDWWFKNIVDPIVENQKTLQPKDNSIASRLGQAVGGGIEMLGEAAATGGGSLEKNVIQQIPGMMEHLQTIATHGFKGMALPALKDATDTYDKVLQVTNDKLMAARAAFSAFTTTEAAGVMPLSGEGKLLSRMGQAAVSGAVTSEAQRQAMNTVLPKELQSEFDPTGALINAAAMAPLGAFHNPGVPDIKPKEDVTNPELHNKLDALLGNPDTEAKPIDVGPTPLSDGQHSATFKDEDSPTGKRTLMEDPSGGHFWGDYDEGRTGTKQKGQFVAGGEHSDYTPARFDDPAEAKRVAESVPQDKTEPQKIKDAQQPLEVKAQEPSPASEVKAPAESTPNKTPPPMRLGDGTINGEAVFNSFHGKDMSHLIEPFQTDANGNPTKSTMNVGKVLAEIAGRNDWRNAHLTLAAKAFQKFPNLLKNLDIIVHHDMGGMADKEGSAGYYGSRFHALHLGSSWVNDRVIIHEMAHALTSRAINFAKLMPGKMPKADLLVKQIRGLMNEVRGEGNPDLVTDKDGIATGEKNYQFKEQYPEVSRSEVYGLKNEEEFVAEAHSNLGFQLLLKKMNVWDKLKNAMSNFLGIPKNKYDQIIDLSHQLMELGEKHGDQMYDILEQHSWQPQKISDPVKLTAKAIADKNFGQDPAVKAIGDVPGLKALADRALTAAKKGEEVLDMAKKEKDIPDGFWAKVLHNFTVSGDALANLRDSPALYHFARIFDRGLKVGNFYEDHVVTPLRESIKQIIPDSQWKSLKNVKDVMIREDLSNKRLEDKDLEGVLNDKERQVYKLLRDAFDKQWTHVNEARLAQGLEPVKPREAYMASHWDGPYKGEVHQYVRDSKTGEYKLDKNGNKVVKYLGPVSGHSIAEVQKGLDHITKTNTDAFVSQKPKYKEDHEMQRRNVVQTYRDMVALLGKNDEGVQSMRRALEAEAQRQGMQTADYMKHFETKKGARYFHGDRPWMDPRKDTQAWFEAQLDTIHDGYKWSGMQEAIGEAKKVTADKDFMASHPNMHNLMTEFARTQMGFGKLDWVGKGENAFFKTLGEFVDSVPGIRNVPVDMRTGTVAMKYAKNLIYLKALGFWKPQHFLVNGIFQPFFTMPRHLQLSQQGYEHNMLKTVVHGIHDASQILLNHYFESIGKEGPKMDKFANDMYEYIKENKIATNNPYSDVGAVGRSKSEAFLKKSAAIGGFFMQEGERLSRVNAFVSFAHHLQQSGKFTDQAEMFREAERHTTETMGSFKHTDRPMAFQKLGLAGSGLATLRQFELNFISQHIAYTKYAMKTGNYGPLLAMAGIQTAFAGVMGFLGFETADAVYRFFRDLVPTSMVSKEFAQWSPKQAAMQHLPTLLAHGLVSPMTGINFASSLEAGTIVDPSISGLLPFVSEIRNTIVPTWDYISNPTDDNLHKFIWNQTPYGSRGMLETGKFAGMDLPDSLNTKSWYTSPSGVSQSPNNPGTGTYTRDKVDEEIRSWGFTSAKEAETKEVEYQAKENDKMFESRQKDMMDNLGSAIRNNNFNKAGDYIQKYIDLQGDPTKALSNDTFRKMVLDWNTDYKQRVAMGAAGGLSEVYKYQRLHELLDQTEKYYGPANAAR